MLAVAQQVAASAARMTTIEKGVKMNRMFITSALALSLLAGCGKTIPECGDPQVQTLLGTALKEAVTSDVLDAMKVEIPDAVNPAGGLTYWSIVSATSTVSPSVTGFSSTKMDKDAGRNYCQAVNSSYVTHEVKIKLDDLIVSSMGEGIVAMAVSSATTVLEELVKLNDGAVKANGTIITVTIKETLPKTLNYTANLTDKGDQLVVTLQP